MSVIALLFGFLAAIHLLPAVAAIAPTQLAKLYGVSSDNKTLTTLLQHRAIMLGLVGGAFTAAAMIPELRWPALIGGSISMVSFLLIAAMNGSLGGPLKKIAVIDALGLPAAGALAFLLNTGT